MRMKNFLSVAAVLAVSSMQAQHHNACDNKCEGRVPQVVAIAINAMGNAASTIVPAPSGEFCVTLNSATAESAQPGAATLDITYIGDNAGLKGTRLGLKTAQRDFSDNLRLVGVTDVVPIVEDYTMLAGKRSHCTNRGNERAYVLVNDKADTLTVRVRAYDDGVALRYELPAYADDAFVDEATTFVIPDGTGRWIQTYEPLSYEALYPYATSSDGPDGKKQWAFPALVQNGDSLFTLITESGLERGHCASYLSAQGPEYRVTPGSTGQDMSAQWHSPWRLLIAGSLADIVESTLVTDVAPECALADTEWIVPGPASWIYWAYNHGSKDYQIVKSFTDLAAEMHWPYVLIDWEWDAMDNGGNLVDAVRYAHSVGVKPLIWYNSSTAWVGEWGPKPMYRLNSPEARDQEMFWLNQIGVNGVKVDFFNGDGAETVNYFIDLLEDGAAHKLLVTLHGATIPRGWQRTYPNLMTVEGVYGAEWYNNRPDLGPVAATHNATLPFTRNVVGPMDYTPGTFSDTQHPHFTTHSHELALPILFESGVQHMPDRPDIYQSMPVEIKEMLSGLPTAWDDTRLLSGFPGESVVMARRKADKWYVAGINGTDSPVELTVDISPLGVSATQMLLITDTDTPREFGVHAGMPVESVFKVQCLPKGGFVAVF